MGPQRTQQRLAWAARMLIPCRQRSCHGVRCAPHKSGWQGRQGCRAARHRVWCSLHEGCLPSLSQYYTRMPARPPTRCYCGRECPGSKVWQGGADEGGGSVRGHQHRGGGQQPGRQPRRRAGRGRPLQLRALPGGVVGQRQRLACAASRPARPGSGRVCRRARSLPKEPLEKPVEELRSRHLLRAPSAPSSASAAHAPLQKSPRPPGLVPGGLALIMRRREKRPRSEGAQTRLTRSPTLAGRSAVTVLNLLARGGRIEGSGS